MTFLSHDSSVGMVTRLCAAQSGVQIPGRVEIFLFSKSSRLSLGPTLFPTQWLQGSFTVVRQLGPLYSSSANVKKECSHGLLHLYAIVARTGTTLLPHLTLKSYFNPLNAELNPICYLLALLAHHFLHVSRIRVKSLTLRLLMSHI